MQPNTLDEKLLWFLRDTQIGTLPRPIIGTVCGSLWNISTKGTHLKWTIYAIRKTDSKSIEYHIDWREGRFSDDVCTEILALLSIV